MGSYLLGVVLFALGIALTIAWHELGHFGAARLFGMRVRRFFIGFGPTVWSARKGHTQYGLKLVPLGGFCDIAGMTNQDDVTEDEAPHAMRSKPWWQRIIVMLGGIVMNLVLMFVLLFGVAVTAGLPNPNVDLTPTVGSTACVPARQVNATTLETCSGQGPAERAGLRAGDRIVGAEGTQFLTFEDLRTFTMAHPDSEVAFDVERAGERLTVPVHVEAAQRLRQDGTSVTVGLIGVSPQLPSDAIIRYRPLDAVGGVAKFSGALLEGTVRGLISFPAKIPGVAQSIVGGQRDQESPMSVVGASRVGGELAQRDAWSSFVLLLANLNLFLALFNLVPLPPLDGGHIAVVLYERNRDRIRRWCGLEPLGAADYDKLMPLTYVVASLLLVVGVIVILADIVNPVRLF